MLSLKWIKFKVYLIKFYFCIYFQSFSHEKLLILEICSPYGVGDLF